MANKKFVVGTFTLCWDCKKAIGGCPWSDRFEPVEGWDAKKFEASSTKPYPTYIVKECPLFERDALNGGTRRLPRKEIKL